MATVTMSVRVPAETKRWLERFSKGRGSGGGAAALLLEEARRRDIFRAIDFRDTSIGRLAYVQGTRVPVFFVRELAGSSSVTAAAEIAVHYGWPVWKAESALAYAGEFSDELLSDAEAWKMIEEELPLRLPGLEVFPS